MKNASSHLRHGKKHRELEMRRRAAIRQHECDEIRDEIELSYALAVASLAATHPVAFSFWLPSAKPPIAPARTQW